VSKDDGTPNQPLQATAKSGPRLSARTLAGQSRRDSAGDSSMEVMGYEWQDRRVLVTGASGFKGSWLCAVLLDLGARVSGTTRPQTHPLSSFTLLDLEDRISRAHCDISDRQDVYDTINRLEPDVIFHLAAKALVPTALRDPRRTFAVNMAGTMNVIEACRKLRIGSRLLVCSTDHVFGYIEPEELPEGGFPENGRVSYGGPYDTSKSAMELMVRSYHRTYWEELPGIGISRCANVFGYGDVNPRRVLPLFVGSALERATIPLKYRHNGRQFIHMADAIAGYVMAASSLNEGGAAKKSGSSRPSRRPFTPTFHFAIEDYEGTQSLPLCTCRPVWTLMAIRFPRLLRSLLCFSRFSTWLWATSWFGRHV
jgi:CDP-glucose 4,6-dehydratase